MEVTAQYLDGTRFAATARGHRVICDQPRENGGNNEGMTPPEFLLTALATCAGYYAVEYLRTRLLPSGGLNVRVTAEKAPQPARLGSFCIELMLPGLNERHEAGLLRSVKTCVVHNTLIGRPNIAVVVNPAAAVLPTTTTAFHQKEFR